MKRKENCYDTRYDTLLLFLQILALKSVGGTFSTLLDQQFQSLTFLYFVVPTKVMKVAPTKESKGLFLHDRKMIKYTIVFSKCNMQHCIKYTVSNTKTGMQHTVVNHSNYVTSSAFNNTV